MATSIAFATQPRVKYGPITRYATIVNATYPARPTRGIQSNRRMSGCDKVAIAIQATARAA